MVEEDLDVVDPVLVDDVLQYIIQEYNEHNHEKRRLNWRELMETLLMRKY